MAEEEKPRKVVVDTYALLSMAYGELTERASDVLKDIRKGIVEGIIPVTVAYEYTIHWYRGRIPVLRTLSEVVTFLTVYFRIEMLGLMDWLRAAEIKSQGDKMLQNAEDPGLRSRRLSIVDSTIVALAQRLRAPILTGDKDLAYVAKALGLQVVW
ncbi:PIN domain-containing protein [Pyrofollis japonicus]|uniref:PIN domain-containing protein n=1 Tax=Pyrofollis japonicus TaxID=3060460 RepID=UPI00295BD8A4|nr:PIN domain-containing protein [Pyrofollis japonicus]BEP17343.1 PIN domain-containing protein [Pyrofollis japonicus]